MSTQRIKLSDNFQFSMFRNSMNYLNKRKRELSPYDLELYRKLRDGYDRVGREMTITVRQMNHLRQCHRELEAEQYNGR